MKQTPSQTVGPFFSLGLTRKPLNVLVSENTAARHIRIEGRIFDGDGRPVPDAMLEIWQANSFGRYNHPEDKQEKPLDQTFSGWGRCGTDQNGNYSFETIKPGSVPGNDGSVQAPHINVALFARGMLVHAFTRIYFADEATNETDPVLLSISNAARRGTLIAPVTEQDGTIVYRFDIRMQGKNETVFFNM
jgi:protocatechuate 3,4-dioxygenase alpha subunit